MSNIAILTDSTAYLPEAFLKSHNIHVIPLKIHWDGTNYEDNVDITPAEFYDQLAGASTVPTTSQPPVDEFLGMYEKLAEEYEGIIVPLISSGISGTISSAQTAASMFSKVPVEVIDTHTTSAALALIVTALAQASSEGADLETLKQKAEELVSQTEIYFAVDTLEYLHKGGRIGGASRYFGTAFSIKPILYLNEEGKIGALERVRTKRKAVARLIELAVEKSNGKPVHVGVLHANALSEAEEMKKRISDQVDCQHLEIYELSPVIGTHVGPGTLGVAVF
ncbi:MAG: DegV family protein [Chloroflexi bacterium]|nr:MAG: DegV family protein [Chloroflexota bacterium]MBL1193575.1 DegV family protein [Chloroflexota bacterium]NOH10866.1 DegV family protein [Chloroflexota bacterium]